MGDRSSDEGEGASDMTEESSRDTTLVPVICNDNAKTVMKGKQVAAGQTSEMRPTRLCCC